MRNLFLIIILVTTCLVTNAQKGFHAGLKFIPQSVWMFNKDLSDDPTFRYRSKFRFAFGGSFDYHFSDKAGVGLDLIYSPQGQAYVDCESCDEKHLWEVNYFKLPILIHFNGDPENVAMFVGEFGPQFAFLTSSEDEDFLGDTKELFKTVNIGLVLGLGVGFNITDYLVATVKIRMDAGLSNAGETDFWGDENRVWMVTGGLPEIGIKYVLRTD